MYNYQWRWNFVFDKSVIAWKKFGSWNVQFLMYKMNKTKCLIKVLYTVGSFRWKVIFTVFVWVGGLPVTMVTRWSMAHTRYWTDPRSMTHSVPFQFIVDTFLTRSYKHFYLCYIILHRFYCAEFFWANIEILRWITHGKVSTQFCIKIYLVKWIMDTVGYCTRPDILREGIKSARVPGMPTREMFDISSNLYSMKRNSYCVRDMYWLNVMK